jgi:hypothetical protein
MTLMCNVTWGRGWGGLLARELSYNDLSGTLPTELGLLTALNSL